MAEKVIKNSVNDFQLVFSDNYVAYQQLTKKGLFSKEYVVSREAKISYRNIDFVEFNKLRTGTGFTTQLEVIIQLINPQPEFRGQTVSMVFVGCYMDYELNPIIKLVEEKTK